VICAVKYDNVDPNYIGLMVYFKALSCMQVDTWEIAALTAALATNFKVCTH